MKINITMLGIVSILLMGMATTKAQVNLQNGLVTDLSLDGNAIDRLNTLGTPTINGITYVADRFGIPNKAVLFDNDNDYIKYRNPATSNIKNWTISVWARPDNLSGPEQVIVQNGLNINCISNGLRPDCGADGYAVAINNSKFAEYDPGVTSWVVQGTSTVTSGAWIHLIVSRDNNGLTKFYKNGALINSFTPSQDAYTPTAFILGRIQEIAYGSYYSFRGAVDDVKIYNRVLNDQEISTLSKSTPSLKDDLIAYYPFNGDRKDYSGNNNHITTVSGTQFVDDRNGNSNSAVSFAGGADRLSALPSNSLNTLGNGMSISLWVKQTSANCSSCAESIPNYGYVLVAKQEFGTANDGFMLMSRGTANVTGKRSRFIAVNNSSSYIDKEASKDFALNKWNHLVVTYDRDTVKFYQNDSLTNAIKSPLTTISSNNFNLTLGGPSDNGNNAGGFNFKGQMDEVRIYSRALSSSDVHKLYNAYEVQLSPALCTPTTVTSIVTVTSFQTVTVTNFQTVTVTNFQTVTVTNFQTLTVTSVVTVHDCGSVTGSNVGGRTEASSITVFPNPSTSKISIVSNGVQVFNVEVIDSRGVTILQTYYPSSIDVALWPNGVYMLRAKDEEGNVLKTFKVIKE